MQEKGKENNLRTDLLDLYSNLSWEVRITNLAFELLLNSGTKCIRPLSSRNKRLWSHWNPGWSFGHGLQNPSQTSPRHLWPLFLSKSVWVCQLLIGMLCFNNYFVHLQFSWLNYIIITRSKLLIWSFLLNFYNFVHLLILKICSFDKNFTFCNQTFTISVTVILQIICCLVW